MAYLARSLAAEYGLRRVHNRIDLLQAQWKAFGNSGLEPSVAALAAGLRAAGDSLQSTLAFTGDDVMRVTAGQGPVVGEALAYLKDLVLRDPAQNNREALEAALRDWWKSR